MESLNKERDMGDSKIQYKQENFEHMALSMAICFKILHV